MFSRLLLRALFCLVNWSLVQSMGKERRRPAKPSRTTSSTSCHTSCWLLPIQLLTQKESTLFSSDALLYRAVRSISFPPYHDKHSACAATCSKPPKLSLLTSPQAHLEFCCHPMLGWEPGFLEPFMELVRFSLESLDELLWHSWSQVLWTQLNAPFQVTSKMALLCGQEPKALWTGYHHHSQSWSLSKGKLAELWRNLIIWGTWPMRGKWSCTIQLS